MSRTIPAALQSHLSLNATTRCNILQIKPPRESAIGYSSINQAITFDAQDGYGAVVYQIQSGVELSALVSNAGTEVDNAEAKVLLLSGGSVTEAKINAGVYDGAEFTLYEVNYNDLTAGRCRVVQHGFVGRARTLQGSAFTLELRAVADLLRQEPWEKWQMRCRVRRFGSQVGEEMFPCRYSIAGEWVNAVAVTSVGTESTRTFTASSLAQAANHFAPGMLIFTTGPNTGLSFEVESFGAGGVITLAFPAPYAVAPAHQFNLRRDCSREWSGHNSCSTYNNRLNFRGEPKIKSADALSVQVPGASVGPGAGGETIVPETAPR